jgi:hypothetical protein
VVVSLRGLMGEQLCMGRLAAADACQRREGAEVQQVPVRDSFDEDSVLTA